MELKLTFIVAQVILATGMATHLLCRRLFRLHHWLPAGIAWLPIMHAVIVSCLDRSGLDYFPIVLLISLFCSLLGMSFFFLPQERESMAVAFWTLWPLCALSLTGAFFLVAKFISNNEFNVSDLYVVLLGGFSPSISAFILWFYHRFRARKDNQS